MSTVREQASPGRAASSRSRLEADEQLVICIGEELRPPSIHHRPLLDFTYGEADWAQEASVHVPLALLGASRLRETWWYGGEVWHRAVGQVEVSGCDDFIFLRRILSSEETADLRAATNLAYRGMLEALAEFGAFRFVRAWNYLGDINQGENDRERYRQFSIGRAEAFRAYRVPNENSPVATAIGGNADCGLEIFALASRSGFQPIENPRQLSAFKYPRQYGPQSPRFSRSGIVPLDDGTLFLVSGTAAIVGHESVFPFDTGRQVQATLDNLESLAAAASGNSGTRECGAFEHTSLRAYIRNASDFSRVRDAIAERISIPDAQVIYLQGDICRQELMVEIEGSAVING